MTYLKNLLFVLVLFFIGVGLSCATSRENIPDLDVNKIINGWNVGDGSGNGTGIVMIKKFWSFAPGYCSGVLIKNDWILTNRHCLESKGYIITPQLLRGNINNYVIMYGNQYSALADYYIFKSEEKVSIDTSDNHYKYDVALIKLETPFLVNGSYSSYSLDLYAVNTNSITSGFATCYGYGDNNVNETGVGILRTALLQIVEPNYSETIMKLDSSTRNAFGGDSGGPCFINGDNAHGQLMGLIFAGDLIYTSGGAIEKVDSTYIIHTTVFREWATLKMQEIPRPIDDIMANTPFEELTGKEIDVYVGTVSTIINSIMD